MYFSQATCICCLGDVNLPLTIIHSSQWPVDYARMAPPLDPPIALINEQVTCVSLCLRCTSQVFATIQRKEEDRLGVAHFGAGGGCLLDCPRQEEEYDEEQMLIIQDPPEPEHIIKLYVVPKEVGGVVGDEWVLRDVVYCDTVMVLLKGKVKT